MSEAIENMDNIKSQLEMLMNSKKAAEKIKTVYDQYNRVVLFEKIKGCIKSRQQLKQHEAMLQNIIDEKLQYKAQWKNAEERILFLKAEEKRYKEKEQQLKEEDGYKLKARINELEKLLEEFNKQKSNKTVNLDQKKSSERRLTIEIKELEGKISSGIRALENSLCEMDELAEAIAFHEQAFIKDELLKDIKAPYNFEYSIQQLKKYQEKIRTACIFLREENQKMQDYDKALKGLELAKNRREIQLKELEKAVTQFLQVREEMVEKIYKWEKENRELKPDREILVAAAQKVKQYGDEFSYDDIVAEIRIAYGKFESSLRQEESKWAVYKENIAELIAEKEKELEIWNNKKDPEPVREEKVLKNRQQLAQKGIPFIPLYMAIDFQENLNEELKSILEESLLDMGLLDALVIPPKYGEEVLALDRGLADKYIFSQPQYLQHELSKLLKPDQLEASISFEEVDNVLKSILMGTEGTVTINEQGHYSIGFIKGKVSGSYTPRFIGTAARKKYRMELMNEIRDAIEVNRQNLKETEEKMYNLQERIKDLAKEFSCFPGKEDIETAYQTVQEYDRDCKQSEKEVELHQAETEKMYQMYQAARQKVREATDKMEIPVNLAYFEEALENAADYREELTGLKSSHQNILVLNDSLEHLQTQYEEVLEDLDNVLYDLKSIESNIKNTLSKKNDCEERLKLTDYEAVEKEIEECIIRLSQIPEEILQEGKNSREGETKLLQKEHEEKELSEKIIFQQKLYKVCREGFLEELALEYVISKEEIKEIDADAVSDYSYQTLKETEKSSRSREDLLTFSLSWRNKTKEAEEQLDTAELVALLKMDSGLLRSEDFQKLSLHFQSKILEARKAVEETGRIQSFHAIMKEILDYRKWFEFQRMKYLIIQFAAD